MNVQWDAVGSIATALAVLVALFGPFVHDWYGRRRRRPRVSLRVKEGDVTIGVGSVWSGRQMLEYFQSNEAGRDAAEDVQVYVSGTGCKRSDAAMAWWFGDSTQLRLGEGTVTTLPPNFSRRCTFGWLEVERGADVGDSMSPVGLMNTAEGSLQPINTGSRYDVIITVTGSNFDALTAKGSLAVTKRIHATGESFVEAKWQRVPTAQSAK